MIIQNLSGSSLPAPLPSDGPVTSSASPAPNAPATVPPVPGVQGSGSPQSNGSQPSSAQSEAQVKAAVASLNQSTQFLNRGVTFSIDQSTRETVVN
ncbi:MAG: flagellar protein FlaG, partial [Betaproteobacteria bacterium]|nr:flagellar protein FlaG [Betaproteobacteria bacterium]